MCSDKVKVVDQQRFSAEHSRSESWISLTLSRVPLDKKDPGYQPPLPAESVIPLEAPPPSRSAAVARGGQYVSHLAKSYRIYLSYMYTFASSLYSIRRGGRRGRGRGGSSVMFGGMSDDLLEALTAPLPPALASAPASVASSSQEAPAKPTTAEPKKKQAKQKASHGESGRGRGKQQKRGRGAGSASRTASAEAAPSESMIISSNSISQEPTPAPAVLPPPPSSSSKT